MLEDALGPVPEMYRVMVCNEPAWGWFIPANATTRRCPSREPSWLSCSALASQKTLFSSRRAIYGAPYHAFGRRDEALILRREVYSGFLKLLGEETQFNPTSANNYGESHL